MSDEKRQYHRLPARLEVRYPRRNAFFADFSQNISKGGLFVQTKDPLEIGTVFQFDMYIPGVTDPISLMGEVRWLVDPNDLDGIQKDLPEIQPGMGVAFLFDTENDRKSIYHYVEQLMRESLGDEITEELLD